MFAYCFIHYEVISHLTYLTLKKFPVVHNKHSHLQTQSLRFWEWKYKFTITCKKHANTYICMLLLFPNSVLLLLCYTTFILGKKKKRRLKYIKILAGVIPWTANEEHQFCSSNQQVRIMFITTWPPKFTAKPITICLTGSSVEMAKNFIYFL